MTTQLPSQMKKSGTPSGVSKPEDALKDGQKVTNITNIIYNFNYGTPQSQNQPSGQSLLPGHASNRPDGNIVGHQINDVRSNSQQKKQSMNGSRKQPKIDPSLQIKVGEQTTPPKDPSSGGKVVTTIEEQELATG